MRKSNIKWGGHQVLESVGEYDACLNNPRVGNRGRGMSGAGDMGLVIIEDFPVQ